MMKKNKKPSASSIMFVVILLFILFDILGYQFLVRTLKTSHEKDQKILYYEIDQITNSLLSKLLFQYQQQKTILINKHKEVLAYLQEHGNDTDLQEIYEKINKNSSSKAYDIYITDENLIIKNTTRKKDMNFDLSFAKDTFIKHKNNDEIGYSAPVYPDNIYSYSDSYLDNEKGILQVSYRYQNLSELKELQTILDKDSSIENYLISIFHRDDTAWYVHLGDSKLPKPSPKEIETLSKHAKDIFLKAKNKSFIVERVSDNKIRFFANYKNSLFNDFELSFFITLNNNKYTQTKNNLNIAMGIFTILGLLTIFLTMKFNRQEKQLFFKNKFIAHSLHEIKTPLSIISLNNELRSKIFGQDRYSTQIQGAIRSLTNSYEDMSFLLIKSNFEYKKEDIILLDFLKERIAYFDIIAQSQSRKITLLTKGACGSVHMSKIELTRLIDNNLSNAIKYSNISSIIDITLSDNQLFIKSIGNPIKNKKDVFKKFIREDETQGGHGLGLSIVHDICKKYKIKVKLETTNSSNTFIYTFNYVT